MTTTATAATVAVALRAGATALTVYDAALRLAAAGLPATLTLRDDRGDEQEVDAGAWCRPYLPGDAGLLRRCRGATLDVGCGPGRLVAALSGWGRTALGIDISPAAVRLTRRRGAAALRRDVFGPLPGRGRWRSVLLADGNIGIAGDPVGLLRRCRTLLARDGRIQVEVAPPGSRGWAGHASIRVGSGPPSAPFRWASVPADRLDALAERAALRIVSRWTEAGRWFAELSP
jgi:SAM-dependent methyltransferase